MGLWCSSWMSLKWFTMMRVGWKTSENVSWKSRKLQNSNFLQWNFLSKAWNSVSDNPATNKHTNFITHNVSYWKASLFISLIIISKQAAKFSIYATARRKFKALSVCHRKNIYRSLQRQLMSSEDMQIEAGMWACTRNRPFKTLLVGNTQIGLIDLDATHIGLLFCASENWNLQICTVVRQHKISQLNNN